MWGVIINPKSGKKALRKQRKYLFQALRSRGVKFDYHITQYAYHAKELARDYVEAGVKKIMILGGDGTTNEVINGIFTAKIEDTSDVQVALVPRGTGNDWARQWGLTKDYKHAIDVAFDGEAQIIDVGQIEYVRNKEAHRYYFINSIGFGLDQCIVHQAVRMKFYWGSHAFLYPVALLLSIFRYKARKVVVSYNQHKAKRRLVTMNIANGKYSGGGIIQNPGADPSDGMFHGMIIERFTLMDVVRAVPRLFDGRLGEVTAVEMFQTDKVKITTNKCLPFEADGIEVCACGPYTVSVVPRSLQMIKP